MASGATLVTLFPFDNEPPSANYATFNLRNGHPVLDFDATTQEISIFTAVMPRNYGGGGVTVYVHSVMASASSGTLGWEVAFERMSDGGTTDIDSDSFAASQTISTSTVTGTVGGVLVQNVSITNGANMDGIVAGDSFRIRIRRDVASDNATGDAEFLCCEIKET